MPLSRDAAWAKLCEWTDLHGLDALIVAVAHQQYLDMPQLSRLSLVRVGGVVVDVKAALDPDKTDRGVQYWSL